jgi:hypothetical protein
MFGERRASASKRSDFETDGNRPAVGLRHSATSFNRLSISRQSLSNEEGSACGLEVETLVRAAWSTVALEGTAGRQDLLGEVLGRLGARLWGRRSLSSQITSCGATLVTELRRRGKSATALRAASRKLTAALLTESCARGNFMDRVSYDPLRAGRNDRVTG